MRIMLNGNTIEIHNGLNVESLVISRGLELSRVVVEINGEIIVSAKWESVMLKENDKVELISFVGGG